VVVVIVENVELNKSFETLEVSECRRSINRVSAMVATELITLQKLVEQYSFWDVTVEVTLDHSKVEDFILDNFMMNETSYNVDLEINYIAFVDNATFKTWWSVYYPPPADNSAQVADGEPSEKSPVVDPDTLSKVAQSMSNPSLGWQHIMVPAVVPELFMMSVEPIMKSTEEDDTVFGYLVVGRNLKPRLQSIADDVPTCLAAETHPDDIDQWDTTDKKNFRKVKKGSFNDDNTYGGEPVFVRRSNDELSKCSLRLCPEDFSVTDEMMSGYFELCDMEPGGPFDVTCVRMRLDNAMYMEDQGSGSITILTVFISLLMAILCVIFVVFLDFVVLQPIVNLSKVLEKQANWEEDDMDRSLFGDSNEAASEARLVTKSNSGDEIGKLKRAMEQNASGLRRRLKIVDHALKVEQRKTMRRGQAIQLLNLWRGHETFFPGLPPNAVQLRYEPPRNIDDLLTNPLAIEFLKTHCETDSTLENLWFILDVSWLDELEKSRDKEQDPERRGQLLQVASFAAATIMERYIAVNATQLVNVSADTFKKLREKDGYERGMFEDAVNEVKMSLSMDIIPRFQKNPSYAAMSEALYINSAGEGGYGEDGYSSDTASSADTILTDDGDDDGGVARVFAKTFKNLHTNFVPDSDVGSTFSTNTSSGNDSTEPSPVPRSPKKSPAASSSSSSSASESSSASSLVGTDSEDSEKVAAEKASGEELKKEEPKKEEPNDEEPKKEEPKKEEPKKEEPKKEEPKKEEPKKEEPKKDVVDTSSSSSSSDSSSSEDTLSSYSDMSSDA